MLKVLVVIDKLYNTTRYCAKPEGALDWLPSSHCVGTCLLVSLLAPMHFIIFSRQVGKMLTSKPNQWLLRPLYFPMSSSFYSNSCSCEKPVWSYPTSFFISSFPEFLQASNNFNNLNFHFVLGTVLFPVVLWWRNGKLLPYWAVNSSSGMYK